MICFSLWASAIVFKTKGNAKSINPHCTSIQHLFCFATVGWLKSFNLQLHVRKKCYIHRYARVQNRCCLRPSWQNRCRVIRFQLQFYKVKQISITLRGSKNQDSIFFFYFCVCSFFVVPFPVLVTSFPFFVPRSQFFVSVTSQ